MNSLNLIYTTLSSSIYLDLMYSLTVLSPSSTALLLKFSTSAYVTRRQITYVFIEVRLDCLSLDIRIASLIFPLVRGQINA